MQKIPRKLPEEFIKFDTPEILPRWPFVQVAAGNAQGNNPWYSAINSKVVEWTGPKNVPFYNSLKSRCAGQHLEIFGANTWYDPKYG